MDDTEPDFGKLFARKTVQPPKSSEVPHSKKKQSKPKADSSSPSAGAGGKPGRKESLSNEGKRLTGNKRKADSTPNGQGSDDVTRRDVNGVLTPPTKQKRVDDKFWPFKVDYNDHFETSSRAIHDVQPVLLQLCKRLKKSPAELVIYDPFFCKGGIRRHYEALGFPSFVHRNRDFYKDVATGNLPQYDILVTNPPYSEDHKERILEFCLRSGKPWALLLPNYVATKAYFSTLLDAAATRPPQRPFFLTPRVRYTYDHPEGTGHAESPFFSIWYVGLGQHTEAVYGACRTRLDAAAGGAGGKGMPGKGAASAAAWDVTLARSVDALRAAKAVPTAKRLNPKQRMRMKKRQGGAGQAGG